MWFGDTQVLVAYRKVIIRPHEARVCVVAGDDNGWPSFSETQPSSRRRPASRSTSDPVRRGPRSKQLLQGTQQKCRAEGPRRSGEQVRRRPSSYWSYTRSLGSSSRVPRDSDCVPWATAVRRRHDTRGLNALVCRSFARLRAKCNSPDTHPKGGDKPAQAPFMSGRLTAPKTSDTRAARRASATGHPCFRATQDNPLAASGGYSCPREQGFDQPRPRGPPLEPPRSVAAAVFVGISQSFACNFVGKNFSQNFFIGTCAKGPRSVDRGARTVYVGFDGFPVWKLLYLPVDLFRLGQPPCPRV